MCSNDHISTELLKKHAKGGLPVEVVEFQIDSHLKDCNHCRDRLAAFRLGIGLLPTGKSVSFN